MNGCVILMENVRPRLLAFFGVCVHKSVCSYALVSYQYLEQGGVGEGKQIVINNTAFPCCLGNPK